MEQRDKRMKTVNEIFSSIQIIKLNAWEEKFADKLSMERAQELKSVWNLFMWGSFNIVFFYLTPIMVTIASFASYTFVQNETLPASKLFTALSYLTMLKVPFSTLSYTVSTGLQALVSLRRIMEFLNLDEKKNVVVWTPATAPACKFEEYVNANIAVALEDASIGWDTEKPLFKNVNLTIKHGDFVVIHGSVGEGKSSLCAAFLGEMAKFSGNIFVGGRIAYFSQQTWIQNLTIRENILFGKPYDREKYNRVIQAWALTKDLSLFAADDRAEIGQKGINLSGGQKARVCLARACYSDADIFILDSPLSAVDAIVQNKIFTKCFLDIIGSKYLDRLVEVKDGQLAETIVENQNSEVEPLIEPLAVLDMVTSNNAGNSCSILISPSISTPQHAAETELFTPVVKSIGHRFGEVASGQLILDEERSEGHVSTQVYKNYLEFDGLATDLWLNLWTGIVYKVTPEEFLNESGYYLAVYALLSLCAAFATSKTLFDQMTNALPRAPMRFFDQNPHGRILNRYTNDIATIDMDIPLSSGFIILTTFSSVCTIATAIYMTNYLVVPILYCLFGPFSSKLTKFV
ncbi:unnamed protein product [Aphanomyces euteiches]